MAKKTAEQKKLFMCSHCDAQYIKWQGRCDECGQWGTLGESVTGVRNGVVVAAATGMVVPLAEVKPLLTDRYVTGLDEFDRVLGGGIVPGSLVLLGGYPGVGKSTLVMQLARFLAGSGRKVLYVSGEESAEQVKQRFDRVQSGSLADQKQVKQLQFMHQEDIAVILATVKQEKPEVVIIDSIQAVYDTSLGVTPGNVNQIRACTGRLMEIAKKDGVAVMIVGHVTKDGALAGPKTLEHMVDTVVYMEGDRQHVYRLVRTVKNRFGSTAEVGVFDMRGSGLVEVKNPSLLWFSEAGSDVPGTVFSAVMEGSRVFLSEVQALVSPTVFGYPLRKSVGLDTNRLHILVAVLGKRARINLQSSDIHVNMPGGFRSHDTALDLAVCLSIISSFRDRSLPAKTLVLGEVGLGGEIRPVPKLEERIQEAARQGFEQVICPVTPRLKSKLRMESVKTLSDTLRYFQ